MIRTFEVQLVLEQSYPSDKITEITRNGRADIIVTGFHGAVTVSRPGSGSASERFVRKVHCALLVVK